MKTNTLSNSGALPRALSSSFVAIIAALALWALPGTARGQIYVTEANGTIGAFTEGGAAINASLISGLNTPTAIAISGNDLYVANYIQAGTIGKYTTAGAVIDSSLISGISGPTAIAVSGTDLFVVSAGVVRKFTTSGATINASFITAVPNQFTIAVSGNRLYVASYGTDNHDGTVAVYDATTGAAINSSLISGLYRPAGMAVSGEDLFITSFGDNSYNHDGKIGKYTTSGATVNASLVSGLDGPIGIAVSRGHLFVVNNGDAFSQSGTTVGEYDAITGAVVNPSLVSGLAAPWGIAVADIAFGGFLAPIGGVDETGGSFEKPVRTLKFGSTIPIKFKASYAGAPVVSGEQTLQAIKYSDATTSDAPLEATAQDAATTGNQFRLADDQWLFNLDTKATGMSPGKWELIATLSDGTQHSVWIQLK